MEDLLKRVISNQQIGSNTVKLANDFEGLQASPWSERSEVAASESSDICSSVNLASTMASDFGSPLSEGKTNVLGILLI